MLSRLITSIVLGILLSLALLFLIVALMFERNLSYEKVNRLLNGKN
ncbi:MAG TPA: hypothetical protein VGD40_02510 [Chryseosolibacter sp.]